MSYSTLEDFFGDIVGKAIRGLGLDAAEMGRLVGLSGAEMSSILSYDLIPEDDTIRSLAAALSLDGDKLIRVAKGWVPEGGNDRFVSDSLSVDRVCLSAGMKVNAYVLTCRQSGESALVDAGGEPTKIQELIQNVGAKITHILLTHGHGDHVGAVGEMKRSTDAPVYCSSADASMLGAGEVDTTVSDGWQTRVGSVIVTAHELPGHTAGGIGYLANDQAYFSGDALFAGSLGGARREAYKRQIELVKKKILGLSPCTKIFPGHGPITTVGQEADNNPCFP